MKLIDQIEIVLRNEKYDSFRTLYIDIFDHSLSRKWLKELNFLLKHNFHLEKNYCFLGFTESKRNLTYLLDQINYSITEINSAQIGYTIRDYFTLDNTIDPITKNINHSKLNQLHGYFEDLQGISGSMSLYYTKSMANIKWHIRQLNLLCHEYESLVLSTRKLLNAPMRRRPSQLMCWLNAPRFILDEEDYEFFGIETIKRKLGGVYLGINKAVGKTHWEVFNDEGSDKKINQLSTSVMRPQTQAAGDFDIEWANNPGEFPWVKIKLAEFEEWLLKNNLNPRDKNLTLGHPQIGQVDLESSFGTGNYEKIWETLGNHLDVYSIRTGDQFAKYDYDWQDSDYQNLQISILTQSENSYDMDQKDYQ